MKEFQYILCAILGMVFMTFIAYAGGSEWGTHSFGWMLFSGAIGAITIKAFSEIKL